jgi:hypothetical protein
VKPAVLAVIAAVFLGGTSCARPAPPPPSRASHRPPRQALSQSPDAVAAGEKGGAQRKIADFLARVADARRLTPRARVQGEELDRAALIAGVRAHVAREVPPDVIRNQGELLAGLGLVPRDFDYEEGTFRLLESQLAGFYEYRDKKMYLASDLDEASADLTLAHELVHALQDQHFDLSSRMAYQPEANDRESAFQALAEGDATSAMMDVMAPEHRLAVDMPDDLFVAGIEGSMNASTAGETAPRVLRASLIAPYVDGVLFVHALRRRGIARGGADATGWSEVDRVWKSPPETTEQLLHIEKFDAREPAEKVAPVAPPAESGWSIFYEDVFGEQGLRISAEQWMPKKMAALVAEGWGGDRLAVFRRVSGTGVSGSGETSTGEVPVTSGARVPSGTYAVAWHIRFDAGRQDVDAEARQAFKALADSLRPHRDPSGNTVCVERGALGPLAVVRVGRDLAVTAGPYERGGTHVGQSAVCPQTVRWASDILRKGKL